MATFQKVADRCEIMLQEDTRYYVFGVYKMDTKQDEHNQAIWLKQLIRCYRNMLGCAVDQSEKEDVTNKGRACVAIIKLPNAKLYANKGSSIFNRW
jgi:hypothetical protein